ncbi:MAG: DNA repair protein RecO [Terrimicrobiaceae bacterium]|nr:DNA repair protein RecO [Terrimicrobiaceae bacterium]
MDQTEAILIRRLQWSDTSLITIWLTRDHGKIRLLARAARRPSSPFAGKLDLFYRAEVGFSTSAKTSLHTLREVRLIEPFDAAAVPCGNVFLCGYFAELVDLCTESGHASPDIYSLLARAVGHLREKTASARALGYFEEELCRVLGIAGAADPLAALGNYCGRIPESRAPAVRFLSGGV